MTRTFIAALLCVSQAFGADITIQLPTRPNEGDQIILKVPAATTPTPIPVPDGTAFDEQNYIGANITESDDWNGVRQNLWNDLGRGARWIAPGKWLVITVSNISTYPGIVNDVKIAGTYTLRANTSGSVSCTNGTVKKIADGIWEVTITDETRDVRIDFGGPVTGWPRFIRPGADEKFITSKTFREGVAETRLKYIRFMNLGRTNWDNADDAAARLAALGPDGLMSWAERPSHNDTSFNRPWGISVEAAVQMCNETKTDFWWPIAWTANNKDFLEGFAAYLAVNLDPGLDVIIEVFNEPWNYAGGFYHSGLIRDAAKAYVAAGTLPKIQDGIGGNQNDWFIAQRYVLLQLKQAVDIVRAKLGRERVKAIYASQWGSAYYGNVFAWGMRTFGNLDWMDGAAGAPYIYCAHGDVLTLQATLRKDAATREQLGNKLAQLRGTVDAFLPEGRNNVFYYEIGVDEDQDDTLIKYGHDPNLANRVALAYHPDTEPIVYDFLRTNMEWGGVKGATWFLLCQRRDKWGPAWGATDDFSKRNQPILKGIARWAGEKAPRGGVTAEYFSDGNFTNLLEKKTVPLINHAWIAWDTGPIHYINATRTPTTEGVNSSIRFSGKYIVQPGVTGLIASVDANDTGQLSVTGAFTAGAQVPFTLKYVGNYSPTVAGGKGVCAVQLLEQRADGKRLVTQGSLIPN